MEVEAVEADVPVAATIEWVDGADRRVTQFGLNPQENKGFVGHVEDRKSVISTNGSSDSETIFYDYTGNERPIAANAEIALPTVRAAVHHFVAERGSRDESVLGDRGGDRQEFGVGVRPAPTPPLRSAARPRPPATAKSAPQRARNMPLPS
ncbi:Imm1 family immunity protein [Actinokineospora sp. G85]|uniref:Imm1 family immunity protein n=1 Tax=Actinokineospora sp. G85 TaxID=3406626 RepID=UPI003C75DCB5